MTDADTGPGSGKRTVPGIPSFTPDGQTPPVAAPWTPAPGAFAERLEGTVLLDRYRILEQIGEGGMGTVYRAEHIAIGKPVAIKMLRTEYSERPDLIERFTREARAAPAIGHDNIVDITDFGMSTHGRLFFVMEYLQGEDLAALIDREGAQPWHRVRKLTLQICNAMAAAHDRGVIHRDMKPANVFRTTRGGDRDFVKIVDFGIAKIVEEDGRETGKGVTQTGTVLGSIEYISPEQARGETPDKRADIYAVGVIMYELLTGRLPFQGRNRLATLNAVMFEAPLELRAAAPDAAIPTRVEELVLRTMSKDPGARPQSMRELAAQIERLDAADLEEAPDRSGALGWLILVVGLLLIGAAAAGWRYTSARGEQVAAGSTDAPDTGGTPGAEAPVEAAPEPAPSGTDVAVPAPPLPADPHPASTAHEGEPGRKLARPRKPETLDPDLFERRVNKLLPRVRACGEQAGAAIGTVIPVDIDIAGASGRPARIELGEGHGATPLGVCVTDLLRALKFTPFQGEKASFKFKYKI